MVQDDVVFCKNLLPYLRRAKLPEDTGVFSPFCPACNNHREFGWNAVKPGYGMASAQTFAFPSDRAYKFIGHPWTVNHRRASPKGKHYRGDGLHHIDGAVGEWCRLAGNQALFHSPSLAQHIGESSIMYPGFTGKRERRFADSFPGENLDADVVLRRYAAELETWLSDSGGSEGSCRPPFGRQSQPIFGRACRRLKQGPV